MQRGAEAASYRRAAVEEPHDVIRGNLIKTLADRWPDDPETRSLLHDLVHVDGSARNRKGVVTLLATRWPDDRTCETLRRVITTDPERSVLRHAGVWLDRIRPGAARSWTLERLNSPDADARGQALTTLCAVWEDHDDVLTALHEVIATDDHPSVRETALRELGGLGLRYAASRGVVRDCLAGDNSPEVRCAALRILDPTADPEAAELVHSALVDPAPIVRAAAMDVLYEHRCAGRAVTIPALYELIVVEEEPRVRAAALRAMVAGRRDGSRAWPDHPEAITWLREYIAVDPFDESRRFALMLIKEFVDVSDVRALLGDIAERHPDESVRRSVITRLGLGDHGDTKAVMRRLASSDPSGYVRACAVQGLGWWGEEADDTELVRGAELLRDIEILCDRAVADSDEIVRGAAWERLAVHADIADVSALMFRRAADDPDADVRAQLLVEIVDDAQYADDRTPTAVYLTERAERETDLDTGQLAAELLTDLTQGDGHIQKRPVGTRYLWY
ncbi:hypothetical protein GV794_21960 [Nocardia cyriacigeorgica]|uniref:HEAT repeat domain-containing protein n=1 Tax=Nocardia cyriacigeorgica TaxID=135487 RepID=A0A6P1DE52_9NOCA|nr:HEAT repeat domain-containing protein [Nocardia cyriacigeorgica]NEW41748.1 hypothetical protein [Nocardia cyriacigeorgica]NEW47070.1 hypothetical protein [Nocardia cyriacigeorgica]NEW51831.1 hypothetical protein [Nocardia cyriacigeorgica]NEW58294.1 hypothetical protein [Nocardia cyriacigeorgica]